MAWNHQRVCHVFSIVFSVGEKGKPSINHPRKTFLGRNPFHFWKGSLPLKMKQYELDLMIYFLGILMSLCCFSLKPVDLGSLHFFCCQCFQMFCCEVFFGNFKNRSSVPPKRFSMRSEPRRLPKHWRLKKKQKLYCIERERERERERESVVWPFFEYVLFSNMFLVSGWFCKKNWLPWSDAKVLNIRIEKAQPRELPFPYRFYHRVCLSTANTVYGKVESNVGDCSRWFVLMVEHHPFVCCWPLCDLPAGLCAVDNLQKKKCGLRTCSNF